MKHPDSTKEQANVPPVESYNGSTTRELAMIAPKRPVLTLAALITQVVVLIAAVALIRPVMIAGVVLFVIAFALLPLTWNGWAWWPRYSSSRILSSAKAESLQPGAWIARPGSKFAVRLWDQPSGSSRNPSIADGLTREELAIIAPVYVFPSTPKGSENA